MARIPLPCPHCGYPESFVQINLPLVAVRCGGARGGCYENIGFGLYYKDSGNPEKAKLASGYVNALSDPDAEPKYASVEDAVRDIWTNYKKSEEGT